MHLHDIRPLLLSCVLLIGARAAAQWEPLGVTGSVYGVVEHQGALFAGTYNGTVQRSTDYGDTWTVANTGITDGSNWWLASEQGALFCGTQFGPVFRSVDDGASWQNSGLAGARGFVSHNDTLYACQWGSGGVDLSVDAGLTWQDTEPITGVSGLWPMISMGGYLFVGGQSGGVRRIANSTDTWTTMNTGLTSTEVYSFTSMGDVLFLGTGSAGGVFRSDDFGATWTITGLTGLTTYALHAMDSLLFAGTSGGGVYLSSDSGATWTPFNNGLPSTQVARLTSDGVYLYAGTLGGGLFRYGITTGVNELRAQHVGIRAYPVPCADVLTTTVHLTTDTELHAQLIDATGKVVAEQRRGRMPAGSHSLTWNVDQLVPGLYGCRVITGAQQGFVQVVVE
jgi:ligand-binding sensor domain-containing protein